MNDLLRDLAPISGPAWNEIEQEAKKTLRLSLAARKVIDFSGPHGWALSALNLGRSDPLKERLHTDTHSRLRQVQPLVELRVPFELSRPELETIGRGGQDADLQSVVDAAQTIAIAEDQAVFHGYPAAQIKGIAAASAYTALTISDDYAHYPNVVAEALSKLRNAGIDGPYAIALGPRCYKGLTETTTSGGYRVFDHVRRLLDGGPVVWAPGIDGAVVMSMRGGDFELCVGQDFSIGYLDHSRDTVQLYIQESFTFRLLAPEAALPLAYPKAIASDN